MGIQSGRNEINGNFGCSLAGYLWKKGRSHKESCGFQAIIANSAYKTVTLVEIVASDHKDTFLWYSGMSQGPSRYLDRKSNEIRPSKWPFSFVPCLFRKDSHICCIPAKEILLNLSNIVKSW